MDDETGETDAFADLPVPSLSMLLCGTVLHHRISVLNLSRNRRALLAPKAGHSLQFWPRTHSPSQSCLWWGDFQ